MDTEKLKALARDLVDEEGENRAVRTFLMQYSCDRSVTVGAMLAHMNMSGWRGTAPDFALNVRPETHLTKAGAQLWLRQLFSLEGGNTNQVGCERDDGLLNIHAESETCEVCSAPAAGTEKDAVSAIQKLENPYSANKGPNWHVSAHAWDMGVIDAIRAVRASIEDQTKAREGA